MNKILTVSSQLKKKKESHLSREIIFKKKPTSGAAVTAAHGRAAECLRVKTGNCVAARGEPLCVCHTYTVTLEDPAGTEL